MLTHTTGVRNIAIGYDAMIDTDGDDITSGSADTVLASEDNIFMGFKSGGGNWCNGVAAAASNQNIAIGNYTMDAVMSGASRNTAIGHSAASAITEGADNVMVGRIAGYTITTGSDNVILGSGADVDASGRAGCIIIGKDLSLNTASDNVVEIGNDSNSLIADLDSVSGTFAVTSDIRIKKDINDVEIGLDFINALRPVTFKKRPTSEYPEEFGVKNPSNESTNKVQTGLIAQEVKVVMDEMDVDFSGWGEGINTKQRLCYETFVMPLIKAVQELSAQVEELKNKQ